MQPVHKVDNMVQLLVISYTYTGKYAHNIGSYPFGSACQMKIIKFFLILRKFSLKRNLQ